MDRDASEDEHFEPFNLDAYAFICFFLPPTNGGSSKNDESKIRSLGLNLFAKMEGRNKISISVRIRIQKGSRCALEHLKNTLSWTRKKKGNGRESFVSSSGWWSP